MLLKLDRYIPKGGDVRNWKEYWGQKASECSENEFFRQVDRTIAGQPDVESVNESLDRIMDVLEIEQTDLVLDLCCGNGIITQKISEKCKMAAGVDYSESLIEIARKYFNAPKVSYYCSSILNIGLSEFVGSQFSKIYMLGSLQYFKVEDLEIILNVIKKCSKPGFQVFIEGIPDIDRIWNFYNTEELRDEYRRRIERKEERIGTWWNREEIIEICSQNNFSCKVFPSAESCAHYRFDIWLSPLD